MEVDRFAEQVKLRIWSQFADTSDLAEELVNTLCNIYFFAQKDQLHNLSQDEAKDGGGLGDLQAIFPDKGMGELLHLYLKHMAHVKASIEYAPKMIENLRTIKLEQPEIFQYFEELSLDLFKYDIANAENKTGIRRKIERKFKSPVEYRGLARKFNAPFRRDA